MNAVEYREEIARRYAAMQRALEAVDETAIIHTEIYRDECALVTAALVAAAAPFDAEGA